MAKDPKNANCGQKPNKIILSRTLFLMVVCGIVTFIVLAARLYQVQIIDHEYYEQLAVEQQTRETTVTASRGTIFDANGKVLAISATAETVYISPYEMELYGEDRI
jgi:stage V sporulation protein D (sporulation-specific penicillin-binding protein)